MKKSFFDAIAKMNEEEEKERDTYVKPEDSMLHKDQPKEPEQTDFQKMLKSVPADLLGDENFLEKLIEKMEYIKSMKQEDNKEGGNDGGDNPTSV